MRKRHSRRSRIVEAAAAGFGGGALVVAVAVWMLPRTIRAPSQREQSTGTDRVLAAEPRDRFTATPTSSPLDPPQLTPPAGPVFTRDPLPDLRDRRLTFPVKGLGDHDLHDSFEDRRGSTRHHEAIDIMAPRNTPILAVEAGVIARLFQSKAGGTTIYQFDPSTTYVYYYAHLERYAEGLQEGHHVERGEVLGYVGTSGNAPKDTPHLHFAIFRLTGEKQWWRGSPINPFDVLQ